jgi:hypothetical protein
MLGTLLSAFFDKKIPKNMGVKKKGGNTLEILNHKLSPQINIKKKFEFNN